MASALTPLASWYSANPRRGIAAAIAAAVFAGLAIAALIVLTGHWEKYRLEGIGLSLDLPAEPTASPGGINGNAGSVYQVRTGELAVIASGGVIPEGEEADASFMVAQALAFIERAPNVTDLRYEVAREHVNGQPCIAVNGTFFRDGDPARLSGLFFLHPDRHAHIICFWSAPEGARQAARILQSARLRG